jgi:hypothetical protein
MFDAISLNDRILGSMVGTRQNLRVCNAPCAEDAKQQMKIVRALFIPGNDLFLENEPACGNSVEHSAQSFWAECSTLWPSAQYLRSIIRPITKRLHNRRL